MKIGNRPVILPHKVVQEAVKKAVAAKAGEVAKGKIDVSTFESAAAVVKKAAAQVQAQAPAPAPAPAKKAKKKGFFAKIGSAISGAAKKVGSAISGAAKKVGSAVAKAAKTVVGAGKNFINGVIDAGVGVVKNIGEAAKTFGGGIVMLFKGDFKGGFKDIG